MPYFKTCLSTSITLTFSQSTSLTTSSTFSKLANHRVEKVEDVVKEGDWLKVKVMEVDKKTGKISLSHKDAIEEGEE